MRMHYQEVGLDDVLAYFAKDFRDPQDGKILRTHIGTVNFKAYVDTHARKVVFQMFVLDKEDET